MGTSHPETKPWILSKILDTNIETILDIGAGSGTYADYFKESGHQFKIDAVEVWKPYVEEFDLYHKYLNVYESDVRDHMDFDYDLVIFGDILEHMTKEEALSVWERVSLQARYAVIAIPIIHYHQPAINDNPYEEHVKEDWSHQEVLDSFSHINDSWQGTITGAYWAKF